MGLGRMEKAKPGEAELTPSDDAFASCWAPVHLALGPAASDYHSMLLGSPAKTRHPTLVGRGASRYPFHSDKKSGCPLEL
jgi:hypothetical protein